MLLFLKARDKRDAGTADMFGTHVETRTRKDGVVQTYHVAQEKPKAAENLHGLPSDKRLPDHNPASHGFFHDYGSTVLAKKPAGHWAYSTENGHHVMYSTGGGKWSGTSFHGSREEAFQEAHKNMKARGLLNDPAPKFEPEENR